MNAVELRYAIYKFLRGVGQPAAVAAVAAVELGSPEPGQPVDILVTTDDPFAPANLPRRYRITIEEIT